MQNKNVVQAQKLASILDKHKLWVAGAPEGIRADLSGANLSEADLRGADLRGADLDYSCLPFWCGGLDIHFDDRQIIQLLYHAIRSALYSKDTSAWLKKTFKQQAAVDRSEYISPCRRVRGIEAL